MIPTLLWRCPLCQTNDALAHITRRWRPDLVRCLQCKAEWRVRRALGDDYYLKVVSGPDEVGLERRLREWYAAMKRTVRLAPIADSAVDTRPAEVLYLTSGPTDLTAESTDPLFFRGEVSSGGPRSDKSKVEGAIVGRGQLALTNQRLVWRWDDGTVSFPLDRLHSFYAMLDYGVAFMVGMRLYIVSFLKESPLKWVNYVGLLAEQLEADCGHRIATSHF